MASPIQTNNAIPPSALSRAKSSYVSNKIYPINAANTTTARIIRETLKNAAKYKRLNNVLFLNY